MPSPNDFSDLLYPLDHPRLAAVRGLDARAFGRAVQQDPRVAPVLNDWRAKLAVPFHGLTSDGQREQGLFSLTDEGAPTAAMTAAARALLSAVDEAQRRRLVHPVDADQWRVWGNPEFLWNDFGLRLEDLGAASREAVLHVIEASLSATGFGKTRDCMRMNAFLGRLTDLPAILNEWSYNFLLFGAPSEQEPWGWSLYGHHLALNCFVLARQMVISPTFMGAEPNRMDAGPLAERGLFRDEETIGLELMRSLPPALRSRATIYPTMQDRGMPEGRRHPADGLHLGGAFQDNRIVPYEGVGASDLGPERRDRLMALAAAFLDYLPAEPLAARLRHIEQHLDRTYWSWIGGWGDEDPFYYRIQSPVVMMEFDHHSGVWLSNAAPAKCHIHTVVRTPNGADYGKDLLRLHYEQVHPGSAPGRT
jgi:hypothetical protein